jgi:DNA-binding MarR family transcriptional regulator/GNAT superfamily N-acetyltransferase
MHSTVAALRVFNRFFTQTVGVLSERHLGLGLTLGQSRVLFEIGQVGPVEAAGLQTHLGLDPGYLSRRLAELETGGLIRRAPAKTDARVKRIELTAKGRRQLARLEAASDDKAHTLLHDLGPAEQKRLCAALTEVQRLLNPKLEIKAGPPDSIEARTCLNAYFAELARRFPGGFDPAASISAAPDELIAFLIVRAGGRPRGCGAVNRLEPGVAEIKRMWLHPEVRGRGVGRQLLAALESHARGCHTVRLDTSDHLPEALALYRSAGYREIPAYNDNPYAAHWFEKRLTA